MAVSATWAAPWPAILTDNVRAARPARVGRARSLVDHPATARDPSDEALRTAMTGYQAGDPDAFGRLHADLAPALRRYLMRLARDPSRVDDLLQETFLQIHRARHTYDPEFPVPPWACAIARHVFLMDCRYRRRRGDLSRQAPIDESAGDPAPAHDEAVIARVEIRGALARLQPPARQSVLLHHLYGLSFREISRRLHVEGPALRARASRGMARLRQLLEHREDDHDQP
jgi:RNA polymerase sigma-70 factor (ECF subfamily)